MTSSRMYMHSVPVRIWHWVNATGIVLLILTGFQIRFAEQLNLLSLQQAISLHNYMGFVVLAGYLFWLAYYFSTGRIKTYIPDLSTLHIHAIRQLRFYGYGFFKGDPNPYPVSPENKFNPLQEVAYFKLMFIMLPAQIFSGLFLWQVKIFGEYITLLGGIKIVDTIHVLLFFFFTAFLMVHCYLATLGHTPLAHYKAMFTGYEEPHGTEARPVKPASAHSAVGKNQPLPVAAGKLATADKNLL